MAVQGTRKSNQIPLLIKSATLSRENYNMLRECSQTFNELGKRAMNEIRAISSKVEKLSFTDMEVTRHLYGKKKVAKIDLERILQKRKLLDDNSPTAKKRRLQDDNEDLDDIEMTYSITSFPNDVQLCYSSVPGHKLGVCAVTKITVGMWIGPYEGKRVSTPNTPGYCWEVYKDGKLDHFLDGSDKHSSSWMRYVRCARNTHEQNMFVIQYGPNIYYRAFKEIKPGEELLVWYENQYEQHFGIPMFINLSSFGVPPKNVTVSQGSRPTQQTRPVNDANNPRKYLSPVSHRDNQVPLHVSDVTRVSIHYGGNPLARQDSLGSLSPPLSTSPIASPSDPDHPNIITQDAHEDRESGLWQCGQCSQRFTQRSALRIHVCPCPPSNPYDCGFCNVSFPDPSKLRDHVLTHKSERPFKCGFCSRTFAGATTLNNHVRTHTGQKPFTCEKCGKTFSQGAQVSRHQRLSECGR